MPVPVTFAAEDEGIEPPREVLRPPGYHYINPLILAEEEGFEPP